MVGLWTIWVKSSDALSLGTVLRSRTKDMTITICHNKPPDRKWGWCVDDTMLGRDGPENLRILKKSQLRVEIGPWRRELGIRPLSRRVEFLGSLPAEMNWDLKHHKMGRTLGVGVSIVWLRKTFKNCVSLLVSKNRSQKLINAFVPEQ